ncbi:MAG TPA: hypothetical protein VFN95_16320 [Flavitalea sp.]|nr:hypothetical protein [Flavitalea sp.]
MISRCEQKDFKEIYNIINDAAIAYKDIIPEDRWHEPYMSEQQLKEQMEDGVQFWGYTEDGKLLGVMGIQPKGDVTLIPTCICPVIHEEQRNRWKIASTSAFDFHNADPDWHLDGCWLGN